MTSYGDLLKKFRSERGVAQRALAREIGLNPTLINRSEAGDRAPAGPDEIAAISRALKLAREEFDQLLGSAGYWPAAYLAIGPSDPTLYTVATTLADPSLADEVKRELRQAIEAIVRAVIVSQDRPRTNERTSP
jgi:transcriptional regulator with XRE-family HTH domain